MQRLAAIYPGKIKGYYRNIERCRPENIININLWGGAC